MFNPSSMRICVGGDSNNRGFVGVRNNPDGELQFYIPWGFDDFPLDDPDKIVRLFFQMYKVLRKFSSDVSTHRWIRRQQLDGVIPGANGFSFLDQNDAVITLFNKIPMIEAILEKYDDLHILVMKKQTIRSSVVDYSRVDLYLANAVYLKDHTAYIDEVNTPKALPVLAVSDLVRMYCFIYIELKRAMEEATLVPVEVKIQADIFKEQFLSTDSALFIDTSHDETIKILKGILSDMYRRIAWKDNDFWSVYRTIEIFLYGEIAADDQNQYWGISSFATVWEHMCVEWYFKNMKTEIAFAESAIHERTILSGHPVYINPDFNNPFYIKYGEVVRYMRPDLVLWKLKKSREDRFYEIISVTPSLSHGYGGHTYAVRFRSKEEVFRPYFWSFIGKLANGKSKKRLKSNTFISGPMSKTQYDSAFLAVISTIPVSQGPDYIIADFKYVPLSLYTDEQLRRKALRDLSKQRVYEAALVRSTKSVVESHLCIPKFMASYPRMQRVVESSLLNPAIQSEGILVYEVNFELVTNSYIEVE